MMARLMKVVLALFYLAGDSARCGLLRRVGYPVHSASVVLMYHAVKSHERAAFAHQMELLLRAAQPVEADFFDATISSRRVAVAVTFDDAYQSVLENAIPILREKRIPFTLFVPTKCLGKRPDWITNKRHPNAHERLLTFDEIKTVRQIGGLIGSHGVTHRPLTDLSDTETLAELTESRALLQKIVGTSVQLFAVPYGASNDDVLCFAKQAGYKHVFLSVPVAPANGVAGFVRGRIEVSPSDWTIEYRLKILGAYRWLPIAITAKRRCMNVWKRFV